jgi:hypothetical protein
LVLKHGEYPRLSINKETAKKIQNSEIRNKVLAQSKTRIPYHLIAWRASGQEVPNFEEGFDISHKCRKGQMRKPGEKGSFGCIENKFGCFSIDCLELSDHGSNLDRGKCLPIIECPFCKLLFKNCKHNPICGTSADVETSFAAQRAVKRASASSTTTAPRLRLPFKITDHK